MKEELLPLVISAVLCYFIDRGNKLMPLIQRPLSFSNIPKIAFLDAWVVLFLSKTVGCIDLPAVLEKVLCA